MGLALLFKEEGYTETLKDIELLTLAQVKLFQTRIKDQMERDKMNQQFKKQFKG